MIELINSGVVFNEEAHTYHLDGKELHGITKYISNYICPNKYTFIKQDVLEKAAKRGSEIHKGIELMNNGFLPYDDKPEYRNYQYIVDTWNLTHIASEYTVTDRDFFATNIDGVYHRNGEIILVDYKTTAKLDHEYLKWQLSINAYLFEKQNPHLQVSVLACMWLRGDKWDYATYERVPDAEVEEFLFASKNNSLFVPNKDALAVLYDIEQEIINIDRAVKEAEERKKQLQQILMVAMDRNNCLSLKTDKLSIAYKRGGTQKRLDSKRLKEENEEMYNKYLTEVEVKPSIVITIKK